MSSSASLSEALPGRQRRHLGVVELDDAKAAPLFISAQQRQDVGLVQDIAAVVFYLREGRG